MFSTSTQYAIRTVLFLSRKDEKNVKHKVKEIAEELNIPQPFLSKILQQLSRSKIVSSTKGRGGGFYLSQQNFQKTIMDIILCIEGYNIFEDCILGLPNCGNANPCHLHQYFSIFKDNIHGIISETSIKDLKEEDAIHFYKL